MANKPVEKKNKKIEEIKKNKKKVVEAQVEPKRSTRVKEVEEPVMSNEMVEKKDDKIWFIIALLLVILIGASFVANKFKTSDNVVENEIKTSKLITENEDGSVEVTLEIKSKVGLKKITLEDGTVLNYNGKKEVEVKFTATENRKYRINFEDVNGKEITKEINITGIKEEEKEEEQELEVEQPLPQINYAPAPYVPAIPVEKPEVEQPKTASIEGITNGDIVNEDVELSIKGTYNKIVVMKDGVQDTVLVNEFVDDGEYLVSAFYNEIELAKVEFEIDKTAPVFYNGTDIINGTYDTVKVFEVLAEDKNEVNYLVKESDQLKVFEDNLIDEKGNYVITATDIAGNETVINLNMIDLFDMSLNQMIFNESITINYNSLLTDTHTYTTTLEKLNSTTQKYEIVVYTIGTLLEEAGSYRLTVNVDGVDVVAIFMIDKVAPTIDITKEDEEIKVEVTDEDSGVKDVEYGYSTELNREPDSYEKLLEAIETPEEEGDFYLWLKATDNADNVSKKEFEEVITVEAPTDAEAPEEVATASE